MWFKKQVNVRSSLPSSPYTHTHGNTTPLSPLHHCHWYDLWLPTVPFLSDLISRWQQLVCQTLRCTITSLLLRPVLMVRLLTAEIVMKRVCLCVCVGRHLQVETPGRRQRKKKGCVMQRKSEEWTKPLWQIKIKQGEHNTMRTCTYMYFRHGGIRNEGYSTPTTGLDWPGYAL